MRLLLITVLFVYNFLQSQSIIVHYELLPKQIQTTGEMNEKARQVVNIINNHKQNFILKANSKGYIFNDDEKTLSDFEQKIRVLQKATVLINDFYYDGSSQKLYKLKENLKIEITNKQSWQLAKETKNINGYTCYKATCEWEYQTRSGNSGIRSAIAWYTPQIPFSYGPNGFQNLPGLILEIEQNGNKLVAKKIELFKHNLNISFPKMRTVDEEKYNEKLLENSPY
ncbi:GLPGLI family protein [Flavobacterium chuncheonense]|uniref:GLPGLI family protein n=1 Tax=Flavobacterium chuncheonense TaxID=2026653 RepID=A0ABW5YP36_9FLAO